MPRTGHILIRWCASQSRPEGGGYREVVHALYYVLYQALAPPAGEQTPNALLKDICIRRPTSASMVPSTMLSAA